MDHFLPSSWHNWGFSVMVHLGKFTKSSLVYKIFNLKKLLNLEWHINVCTGRSFSFLCSLIKNTLTHTFFLFIKFISVAARHYNPIYFITSKHSEFSLRWKKNKIETQLLEEQNKEFWRKLFNQSSTNGILPYYISFQILGLQR